MCSLLLSHPSVGSQRCGARGAVGGFGALLKGLTSVVDNSSRSRDSNPQPRVTSPTLYPLGHDCLLILHNFDAYLWLSWTHDTINISTGRFPLWKTFNELKKKKSQLSLFSIFIHKLYYFVSVVFGSWYY